MLMYELLAEVFEPYTSFCFFLLCFGEIIELKYYDFKGGFFSLQFLSFDGLIWKSILVST